MAGRGKQKQAIVSLSFSAADSQLTLLNSRRQECSQANPKVRKAALLVIGELHTQLGPSFKALILSSCKDASTTEHVETALDKNPFDKAEAEQERSKQCVISSAGGTTESGDSGDRTAVLEAPKLDLIGALPGDCIERMVSSTEIFTNMCPRKSHLVVSCSVFKGSKEGKTAWKTRKGAMDEVDSAMKKCNGLLMTDGPHLRALVDLLRALRERLSDSQSNLKPVSARLIGAILSSVDKQTQPRLGKVVFTPLLSAAMNDNRKPMREACLESIRAGTTESDLEGGSPNPSSLEVLMTSLAAELGESEYKVRCSVLTVVYC
jgi:cytoskeleton-associated protein 5